MPCAERTCYASWLPFKRRGSTWAAGIHEFLLILHENSRRAPPAASILRKYRRLLE